jgi:hypothetical protein
MAGKRVRLVVCSGTQIVPIGAVSVLVKGGAEVEIDVDPLLHRWANCSGKRLSDLVLPRGHPLSAQRRSLFPNSKRWARHS